MNNPLPLLFAIGLAAVALICGQELITEDGQSFAQARATIDDGDFVTARWDADLPYELRTKNYNSGSCVHASTISALEWTGQHEAAVRWRQTYSGGESLSGLVSKAEKSGLTYAYTGNGDVGFLDWASRTRRWAVIFYKPSHSINFCGFDPQTGEAILLDNNATKQYERHPRAAFLRAWKGFGGVALVPVYSPTPPLMWVGN